MSAIASHTTLDLSPEHQELVALAHEFAARELRPVAAAYDESEEFPWPELRKAAEVGFTCLDIAEEYGGGGISELLVQSLISEEMAWGDAPIAGCLGGGSFFAGPVSGLGDAEQRARWLPPLCSPEPAVGALATTEPEAGSDAAAMRTHARRTDRGYVLSGQKTWISCAPVAGLFVVFATVDPGSRARGISAFVLERDDPGFTVGPKIPKLGSRCYPASELFLQDCEIPADRLLGEEGQGFRGLMAWFDRTRVLLSANSVGIGRAALEYAVQYAKERRTFGRPIHENQAVSFRLVDARMRLDQARHAYQHAARLADAGRPFSTEAALAKVAGSEAAWFAAWAACQTLGGYSYSREYPVERWLRNAKLEEIYEGTSDIQRLVIARDMFA